MSRRVLQLTTSVRATSMYSKENILSIENRQKTLAKLHKMKPIRLQTQEPVKKAAIFVPICVANNKASLLYIIRPTKLTEFKERVNFPGDAQEDTDNNITKTALRAANTLLGLQPRDIKIWGMGNIIVARSDYTFVPVIGKILGDFTDNRVILNESVEDVFTVSIEDLCNSKSNSYTQFKDEYSSPVFMGGKWRIWGFTAMITNILLTALVSPQAYTHQIKHVPLIKRGTKFPRTSKHMKK